MRVSSPLNLKRSNQVREKPSCLGRTSSCSPVWPGSVYLPGGSVATRVDTKRWFLCPLFSAPLVAFAKVRAPRFVSALCPLYVKFDEMTRNELTTLSHWNYRGLLCHNLSCNFKSMRLETAWGARGPEFKSRRSDQYLREIIETSVATSVAT